MTPKLSVTIHYDTSSSEGFDEVTSIEVRRSRLFLQRTNGRLKVLAPWEFVRVEVFMEDEDDLQEPGGPEEGRS